MTKNRKLATLLFLLLISALVLSGCAGKPKLEDTIIGNWEAKAFTDNLGLDSLEGSGVPAPKETWVQFTKAGEMQIMADGKPLLDFMKEALEKNGADEETVKGLLGLFPTFNYKVENGKVILTAFGDSQSMDAKLDGDKMTLSDGKNSMEFTKRK